jgi:MerR family transcriptional regulator/heat shock protein HspR
MVGVHQQTLRSYERQGLLQPSRSAGNRRLYSQRDIERLRQVLRLVTDLGVNLAGVDVILRMTAQIEDLQSQLADARTELARLRAARDGSRA